MIKKTELATIDDLTTEAHAAVDVADTLSATVVELKKWASTLPDRIAAAGWGTVTLDTAITNASEAAAALKAPRELLEHLHTIQAELTRARAIGEAINAVGATGNLKGFTTNQSTSAPRHTTAERAVGTAGTAQQAPVVGQWVDPEGDRLAREHSVELAVEEAYRMVVLLAEEDGVELRQVGKVQLRAELDRVQRRTGQPAPSSAEVDAAVERLAGRPGAEVQGDVVRIAREEPEVVGAQVSGELLAVSLSENGWGADPGSRIHFHDDGPIGEAIKTMGPDARLDVDGEPLGDVLGVLATDVVRGVRPAQVGLEALKTLRSRMPVGSRARAALDRAVVEVDAPVGPPPAVPAGTPDYLARLVEQLHAVPLVRRDPGRELEPLLAIAADVAAGRKTEGLRLVSELEALGGRRHESLGDCGKFEIDDAVAAAAQALLDQVKAARAAGTGTGEPR